MLRPHTTELWQLDATQQMALVSTGEISCRELVQAHLNRIEQLNGTLGAITRVLTQSALDAADDADCASTRGPLHGLPFTLKEVFDCMGSPTTYGVPASRQAMPYCDSPVVARLRAAGAIPIARTNLSEMALRMCTTNPLHGRTLSPYDRRLTVGGSSGGDAVAVATGMAPVGIGGDSGGSLRVPAACCGCTTLKPTTGRVAHASSLPPRDFGLGLQLMFAIGPFCRSVADLRLLLPIIAGRDIRDPRSVDAPLTGPQPGELTAALVTSLPGASLDATAIEAVRHAGRLLETAGWQVEEVSPPELTRVDEIFSNLLAAELEALTPQLQPIISDSLHEHLLRLQRFNTSRALPYARLHAERSRLMREWSAFFSAYPVVIGPTLGHPIWPIDADLDPESGLPLLAQATRFVSPGNALGIPSLALPIGPTEDLPCSILIYADLWREDLCLCAAEIIENGVGAPAPVEVRW
jgi:amidase